MDNQLTIKRTDSNDADFNTLIRQLDHELWTIMNEVQATYDQYNKVPDLPTVVLAYDNNKVVGCGCFKKFDDTTVEIKRMFVVPESRGKNVATAVLAELEKWAKELNYTMAVLETGKRMTPANQLYKKNGYSITENYGQYIGLEESVCMKKKLTR
jgi:GNAT superfamily N-acetyltransferase